jgi:hypothetical protein
MAKLQEQVLVIKISRLLKDTEEESPLLHAPDLQSLEQVVQELAGERSLVELQIA